MVFLISRITGDDRQKAVTDTYGIFVRYMEMSFQLVQVHCSPSIARGRGIGAGSC